MNHWKWSQNGELFNKSIRNNKIHNEVNKSEILISDQISNQISNCAIKQSIDGFDNETIFSRNNCFNEKDREFLDSKLSTRELINERGKNPFTKPSNYIEDIYVRDVYLKPINTSAEKIK